jgi:hypothetical protein
MAELLVLDKPYQTGPMAWTDLHAGGVFFCVVYRECLQFGSNAHVRRWREVIDDSRPFHDEAQELRALNELGSYRLNDRGYLTCEFESLCLTGSPCRHAPALLPFNAFHKTSKRTYSLVYVAPAP